MCREPRWPSQRYTHLASKSNVLRERERERERTGEDGEMERERERKRERERFICSTYLCIHWLLLACALTGD